MLRRMKISYRKLQVANFHGELKKITTPGLRSRVFYILRKEIKKNKKILRGIRDST
jgi:hypothetical protein